MSKQHYWFDAEALKQHLQEDWRKKGYTTLDEYSRYLQKEVGSHYIIDHMLLDETEKDILKVVHSERICLEQALACSMIPSAYINRLLLTLPEEVQKMKDVQSFIESTEWTDQPARPFTREPGLYMAVKQPMIRATVELLMGLTGPQLERVLNTDEKMEAFNYAGTWLRKYLDEHPAILGTSRN
tara:strand:- start:2189 stop:2740 length:552 start_codon:yes stop_codon:yes gene_type:complete